MVNKEFPVALKGGKSTPCFRIELTVDSLYAKAPYTINNKM